MMEVGFMWKELKGDTLQEPKSHGAYYDSFGLSEGPYGSREEARAALKAYYEKYFQEVQYHSYENFVLLEVYSDR